MDVLHNALGPLISPCFKSPCRLKVSCVSFRRMGCVCPNLDCRTLKALPEPSKLAKLQLSAAQPCCLRRSVHLPTSQRSRPPRLPQLLTEVLERRLSVGAVSQQSGVFNCFLNAFRACVARGCAVLQQGCKSGLRRSNLPHVLGELEVSISPENISKDGPPQKFQVKNPTIIWVTKGL